MSTINMEDLKPNSNKYKNDLLSGKDSSEKREKLNPVVKKGSVISTKKPLGQKFKDSFMGEDAKEVKDYLFFDVIVPGIKNAILSTISMLLTGEPYYDSRRSNIRRDRDRGSTYSYNSIYRNSSDRRASERRRRDRYYEVDDKIDYRHIILNERGDAEEVVHQMREIIRKNGYVTIAELFDLIDIPGNFNDNNWGWDDERDIALRRVSSGYLIDVAEARYLE